MQHPAKPSTYLRKMYLSKHLSEIIVPDWIRISPGDAEGFKSLG